MTESTEQAKQLFLEAIENHPPEEWDAFLKGACRENPELFRQVEALLNAHRDKDSLFELPDTKLDPPADSHIGQMIGPFKILQQIGEGGFGVVYMAEQMRPVRRKVALKIIKPGMDTKEVVARFEAESQALAMMDHPNIAKVHDGGETESGHPYFVMELVKGVPLTTFCDENKLSTQVRLKLFQSICNAIQHAHQKGVIHRDIKPSNVLVTLHDGQPVPKVIDFGVSKAISQPLTQKTLFTAYGQMVGTVQYMSPEQAEMSGLDIDTRSDIYSLGVLLYELLTGTTPLDPARLRQTAYAELQRLICEEEPPKPSRRLSTLGEQTVKIAAARAADPISLNKLVSGELDWIVMKSLEKERNRRYDSARELAQDIERFLGNEPVSACPPSTTYLLRKTIQRHRVPVLTGMAVFGLLIMGIAAIGAALLHANSEKQIAIIAKQRAEKLKEDARQANESLRDLGNTRTIALAFDAFNSGNATKAQTLLDTFQPPIGDSRSIAWRFLTKRCQEQLGDRELLHEGKMNAFSFDPLGEFEVFWNEGDVVGLSMGSVEKTIDLADFTKRESATVKEVNQIKISSDGSKMLLPCTLSDDTGELHLFDILREGGQITTKHVGTLSSPSPIKSADIDLLQRQIAVLEGDGDLVMVSADTEMAVKASTNAGVEVQRYGGVCFTRDKKYLAAFAWEDFGDVHVFRTDDFSKTCTIPQNGRIRNLCASPCDNSLLICGNSGTEIWDIEKDAPVRRQRVNWQRSGGGTYIDEGKYLAISHGDGSPLKVFDGKTFELVAKFSCGDFRDAPASFQLVDGQLRCVDWSAINVFDLGKKISQSLDSDGWWYAPLDTANSLVAFPVSHQSVQIFDVVSGKTWFVSPTGTINHITAISLSDDGRRVAMGCRNEQLDGDANPSSDCVQVWDIHENVLVEERAIDGFCWTLEFSCRSKDELLVSTMGNTFLWNLKTDKTRSISPSVSQCCVFSPEGERLFVGGCVWSDLESKKLDATLWNLDGAKETALDFSFGNRATLDACFSSDGKFIAYLDLNKIKIWRDGANESISDVVAPSVTAMSLDISPGDECLVAASPSGEITFIDHENGQEIGTFRIEHPVRRVRFMDGQDRIVVGTTNGRVFHFDY
ncbi:WD40 repeat domain-containing serine/threonine protein kinase [Novipirellula artificiosorum]|uniref:Serine/threonine-protein kinase PknB n=1 Tax=Novipirellula artificiosorum TaxID=2528016 RepID=A0A5C6DT87_9BACT|nr:WD40 repeat domain-containing serine/threonine protein kinase [Novipirellula artificiosorum]TWU39515.1 Serine/threonine-protein kinase PknB [Novipirellula artificiosorum]